MIKKIFFFLFFLVFVMVVIVVFRNTIAHVVLNQVLTQTIGAETSVDKVNIGIFDPVVEIKGLKVYNPRGFINETFLELPQIMIGYDVKALPKRQLHITILTITLKELAIAISENGAINVDKLKVLHLTGEKQGPIELPKLTIDKFILKVGRVETKNYAQKDNNVIASVDFKMKERVYKNIISFKGLVTSILVDTMKMAGVKGAQTYGEHLLNDLGKNIFKKINAK